MDKLKLNPKGMYFPMPVTLIGSLIDGRPNFMAVAWISMVGYDPYKVAVTLDKSRKTSEGIRANGCFSVNIPDLSMISQTDYCGIYSGRNFDKSDVFEIFYGENEKIPMIKNCPICWECNLDRIIEIDDSEMFIGDVSAAYSEEKYMEDGRADILKTGFFLYDENHHIYLKTGDKIDDAFGPGKKLRKH